MVMTSLEALASTPPTARLGVIVALFLGLIIAYAVRPVE